MSEETTGSKAAAVPLLLETPKRLPLVRRPQGSFRKKPLRRRRPIPGAGRMNVVPRRWTRGFRPSAPRRVRMPFGCVAPSRSSLWFPGFSYCSWSSRSFCYAVAVFSGTVLTVVNKNTKARRLLRDGGLQSLPRYHSCWRSSRSP